MFVCKHNETNVRELLIDQGNIINPPSTRGIRLLNDNLLDLSVDHLYHIALNTEDDDLKTVFGDVKFVCFGGQATRMESFAKFMMHEFNLDGTKLKNYAGNTDRYAVFKAGPVLSVSHGIGIPSLSIIFQEIQKLLYYAGCEDVTFFRLGTCGGIGVEAGTVVISDNVVDGTLKPAYRTIVMGKVIERPAIVDRDLIKKLKNISHSVDSFTTITGTTMCADDFYEGQGRIDGAFCEHESQDKHSWLRELYDNGVRNMEMESLGFIAMCHRANVKGAVCCVALLNRFEGDGITTNRELLYQWQKYPQILVSKFIMNQLKTMS